MAFNAAGLKPFARTTSNRTVWAYNSADTIAGITGGGYFNAVASEMRVGDLILVVGDSAPSLLAVSSNSGSVVGVTEIAGSGGGGGVGPGDIGTTELADDAVTYAKMQNVSATDKLLGRSTAGAGDVEEITCTPTARSILDDTSTAAVLTTIGAQPLDADLTAIAALTSAANKQPYATGAGTWAMADLTAAGRALIDDADAAAQRVTLGLSTRTIAVLFDGGGGVIPTGVYPAHIQFRTAATVTAWRLVADQVGSIVIDVWSDTYANYPPTVADTIAGSEKPTLSSAIKNEDTSLSTWTTAVPAGAIWRFNVDSASTLTWAMLFIEITV